MALLRCDFFSDVLGLSTSMTVILPQQTTGQIGMAGRAGGDAFPTLYLLHGLSDDDSIWLRRTSIERYVADLGIAVVMPQVHRSYYTDEAYGRPYWTFLSEELPRVASGFFRLSPRREDTFVAGLSMGGYGAFKWALRQPWRFAAAASLSGALDLVARRRGPAREDDPRMLERIFGDRPIEGSDDDLFAVLDRATDRPALYLCCGTEDFLYADSIRFRDRCRSAGIPLVAEFGPGEHDWAYWDAKIQDVLAWLPLDRTHPSARQ
jgi:S-formylglutathione hydrolase FrmB